MSSKTKIVVLHMKELIYTGIFAILGILLIVLLIIMFLPSKEDQTCSSESFIEETKSPEYIPGIYTTILNLNQTTAEIEVIVSHQKIQSIRFVSPKESLATMYPLLEPTLHSIKEQCTEGKQLHEITYKKEEKYTALVLLQAIQSCLQKAVLENYSISSN